MATAPPHVPAAKSVLPAASTARPPATNGNDQAGADGKEDGDSGEGTVHGDPSGLRGVLWRLYAALPDWRAEPRKGPGTGRTSRTRPLTGLGSPTSVTSRLLERAESP